MTRKTLIKTSSKRRKSHNVKILTTRFAVVVLIFAFILQLALQQVQSAPAVSNNIKRKFHLKLQRSGIIQIPGLYDDNAGTITPIQGHDQFNQLILGANQETIALNCSDGHLAELKRSAQTQTISLVQFYMATCPDCQGFSPYFKRFADDISAHWRPLVKIYTVNCNDFNNIHLCQEENPKLIVPMVRWYAPPLLQAYHRISTNISSNNSSQSNQEAPQVSCQKYLDFPKSLLNVPHRKFIEKQRRDLISLRKATLKYINLMLDALDRRDQPTSSNQLKNTTIKTSETINDWLPLHWHQSAKQLGDLRLDAAGASKTRNVNYTHIFLDHLKQRSRDCLAATPSAQRIQNMIIFENKPSLFSMGRVAVADWSNLICKSNSENSTLLIHWTSDMSLLKQALGGSKDWTSFSPILVKVDFNDESFKMNLLALNDTSSVSENIDELPNSLTTSSKAARARSKRGAQPERLGRINQRASLERYYSSSAAGHHSSGHRYATTMLRSPSDHSRHKRAADATAATVNKTKDQIQADADNINWAPELLWPRVELMRYEINKAIAKSQNLSAPTDWPGKQFEGKNQAEIQLYKQDSINGSNESVIDLREDDLSLMMLTDYYKLLDEIVHTDLISKGQMDGYQLLGATCFLKSLLKYFPFQGSAQAPLHLGYRSVSRYYLDSIQKLWFDELLMSLTGNNTIQGKSDKHPYISRSNSCPSVSELNGSMDAAAANTSRTSASRQLSDISLSTRQLEKHQQEVRKTLDVGLAPSNKLSWKYCAGSNANLRGHTCSLWVLFHTMTVQEYLNRVGESQIDSLLLSDEAQPSKATTEGEPRELDSDRQRYQFQIHYDRKPRRPCNPQSPEEAYLEREPSELYVANETASQNVLATIINFVRFYLPCTNCAAHFSCMVEHSQDLTFDDAAASDGLTTTTTTTTKAQAADVNRAESHLLWLWEGHNRVNLRTRGTHSEDRTRPKHIFPVYEACPKCYLVKPINGSEVGSLDKLQFDRKQLVKFIVSRYRKSAILNNKINIEDLYRAS